MDLIYKRNDGVLSPQYEPFGDPNASALKRGWRIHYSKTNYVQADYDGTDVDMNIVGGTGFPSFSFQISGTQFFGSTTSKPYDNATGANTLLTGSTAGSRRLIADEVYGYTLDLGIGEEKVIHFTVPGISASDGPVNPLSGVQAVRWVFHPNETNAVSGRVTPAYFYWTGTAASQPRRFGGQMHVRNDPNTVYVDWKHYVEMTRAGGSKDHVAAFNKEWAIKQTNGSEAIVSFHNGATKEWTLDSSGNWVDNAGGNTVDGVDISTLPASDTNADTICAGTTTYLDGEGGCDTLDGVEDFETATDDAVLVGNGTTFDSKVVPDCDNATTSKLLYDQATNAFSCGTDQSGGGGADVKSGTVSITEGTPQTITFATAFSGTPYCTCTLEPGTSSDICWISTAATTTAVSFDWDNGSGGPADTTDVNWICTDAGDS